MQNTTASATEAASTRTGPLTVDEKREYVRLYGEERNTGSAQQSSVSSNVHMLVGMVRPTASKKRMRALERRLPLYEVRY